MQYQPAKLVLAAMAANLLATPSAEASEKAVALTPISSWNVHWADASCRLGRLFGSADRPFQLMLTAYGPGDLFEISLAGLDLKPLESRSSPTIAFGPGGPLKLLGRTLATTDDHRPAWLFNFALLAAERPQQASSDAGIRPLDEAFVAKVDRITIRAGSHSLVLETGPVAQAIRALQVCTSDLVKTWGLDPVVQQSLTRTPSPEDAQGLTRAVAAVYPPGMLAMGKQARVNIHVVVDAQGAVTTCSTPQSYSDPAFDKLPCVAIAKARFVPALDRDGKPTASYYNTTVTYKIN